MSYSPSEYLHLSGIQHFIFCRRQWALIHIEQQWQDNALTADGHNLHQRVDDPFFTESRGKVVIARSVPVSSHSLGLTGICDVVEFIASADGVQLPERQGFYQPIPIEYKRGHKKQNPCDETQLCAQAICLEEMLLTSISYGYIFYAKTRRRARVDFTEDLRNLVQKSAAEMHNYYRRGYTPKVRQSKACRSCSLADICLPTLQKQSLVASAYIDAQIAQLYK